MHHLLPYNLKNASKSVYWILILTAQTYTTQSLLNDESAHDDHSYSLYRVLTLTTQTYT